MVACATGKPTSEVRGLLHALAFAANQHAGHAMSNLASFGQRCVGTMPASVVRVVSGGPSLTVAALTARSAVEHELVRSRCPVLVEKKFWYFRRGRFCNQANFGGDFLQS